MKPACLDASSTASSTARRLSYPRPPHTHTPPQFFGGSGSSQFGILVGVLNTQANASIAASYALGVSLPSGSSPSPNTDFVNTLQIALIGSVAGGSGPRDGLVRNQDDASTPA